MEEDNDCSGVFTADPIIVQEIGERIDSLLPNRVSRTEFEKIIAEKLNICITNYCDDGFEFNERQIKVLIRYQEKKMALKPFMLSIITL